MSEALEYIEIDIDWCSLNYGVAPCTASIPATGDVKCFNSLNTCQDRANYDPATVTLRFAKPTSHLPKTIDALPWIVSTDFSPAIVSLGENLGQRASFKVTFTDHPHSDAGEGFDKYHDERGYNPYERGTFWPRFRARQPFLRGRAMRWICGFVGDALADMETRHFFIESFDGPTPDGKFTIVAKDVLKFLDGDRSQAPILSNGFLLTGINPAETAITLSPAGIGNSDYTPNGHVCIGGKEIVAFTRSADAMTITRAQRGTSAQSHAAQDRVQLCVIYDALDAAEILENLIDAYTDIPPGYIDLAAWQLETATHLNRVYTTTIAEPTPVNKLVSQLIEQAALALWDDNVEQVLHMQVLRAILTDANLFDESNVMKGTFALQDQPDKRLSQVWVYFGQIDPTKRVEDPDNYRSCARVIDEDTEADFGAAAVKIIYANFIPQFARSTAERVGALVLARYKQAPRKFSFNLMRGSVIAPQLGGGYRIEWWNLQDATGERESVPSQLIRINPQAGVYKVELEEVRFDDPGDDDGEPITTHTITIDFNVNNINLRTAHDGSFPAAVSGDTVRCRILTGVTIGSTTTAAPAFDAGTWPAGVTVEVENRGKIQGKGGVGGNGNAGIGSNGSPGGTAFYTRFAVALDNAGGLIWGGGGGGGGGGAPGEISQDPIEGGGGVLVPTGGGGGGGGGSGHLGGEPGGSTEGGSAGAAGSSAAGGGGGAPRSGPGFGGTGGGPGQAGLDGVGSQFFAGAGANPGPAIDGVSFITGGGGDIQGPQTG